VLFIKANLMPHAFVSIALFAGIGIAAPWCHALQVDTRVDEVTLYGQGATVTRTAQVELARGDSVLVFSGLSAAIDRRRVQVELIGAGVELGQVKFNDVQSAEAIDAQVRALQDQIDAVEENIAAIEDGSSTAQLKLQFLQGIAQGYAKESWFEGARGTADVSSWRGALDVLEQGSAAAKSTIRANAKAIKMAQREHSKLKRDMQNLRGKGLISSDVQVTVASPAAQNVTVKLHYFLRQARWQPQYTAYLDSESKHLRLASRAQVVQYSDEEWLGVKLTLSTSEPSGELAAPEIDSEFLDLEDPQAVAVRDVAKRQRATAGMVLEEVVVAAAPAPTPDVGRYTVTYAVPGRVDVPNDADEQSTFDLVELEFNAELITRIVPRESSTAFLVAKFGYDEALPLYANNLLVYVDQVYVGETWLSTALPGEEVVLPIGQDRRVDFTVRNLGGNKDESGFIGRRKQETTAHLFEIVNRRGTDTLVEVFDRYPTAVHDDIEVDIPNAATVPSERDFDDKAGIVVWRKRLAGGESWKISHQYEVSFPAGRKLVRNPG